jgi:hypothetical protein
MTLGSGIDGFFLLYDDSFDIIEGKISKTQLKTFILIKFLYYLPANLYPSNCLKDLHKYRLTKKPILIFRHLDFTYIRISLHSQIIV